MYFKIKNGLFPYCRASYNKAYENERSVEVSLGRYFLQKCGTNFTVEVGGVTLHYFDSPHTIIDLAEINPRIKNVNALDYDYTGQNVLSISTVEHMMKREYNNGSDDDAINFVKKVADGAQHYLITFGIGYNEFLDAWLKSEGSKSYPRTVLRRLNWNNEWEEDTSGNLDYKFGHWDGRPKDQEGFFNNANGLYLLHSEGFFQ